MFKCGSVPKAKTAATRKRRGFAVVIDVNPINQTARRNQVVNSTTKS